MKNKTLQRKCILYFSNWSRKGYSIFAGLGREVRISHLALSMYEKVLLKSIRKGVIVNTDKTFEWNVVLLESSYVVEFIAMTDKGVVYPVDYNDVKRT